MQLTGATLRAPELDALGFASISLDGRSFFKLPRASPADLSLLGVLREEAWVVIALKPAPLWQLGVEEYAAEMAVRD